LYVFPGVADYLLLQFLRYVIRDIRVLSCLVGDFQLWSLRSVLISRSVVELWSRKDGLACITDSSSSSSSKVLLATRVGLELLVYRSLPTRRLTSPLSFSSNIVRVSAASIPAGQVSTDYRLLLQTAYRHRMSSLSIHNALFSSLSILQ